MSRLTEKNKFDTHYGISISKNLLQTAYDKLGKLEDLIDEMDSVRIVKRDGITSLHIDMILTSDTLPIVKEIFKDKLK